MRKIIIKIRRRPSAKIPIVIAPDFRSTNLIKQKSSQSDFLPRRKKPTGGINFIDLGQIKLEDIFTSLSAFFEPDVTVFSDIQIARFNVTNEDKENFVGEIETEVFESFGEDYAEKFYKIQKTDEPFSKSISAVFERSGETIFEKLNDLPEWKPGGLTLSQSQIENLTIQPDGRLYAINNINFADLENDIDRVTLTHDIEAENVEFTPSTKMDILLMPAALFSYSFIRYKDGIHTFIDGDGETHSDFILKGDYLNFFWHVFDREFWAEIIEIEESELSLYQQSYRQWQIQKQFANARVKRLTYDFIETPPYSYSTTITDEPVEDFPYDAIYQDADFPISPGAGINNDSFQAAEINDLYELQKLKFIIRKNGIFYYFWKT